MKITLATGVWWVTVNVVLSWQRQDTDPCKKKISTRIWIEVAWPICLFSFEKYKIKRNDKLVYLKNNTFEHWYNVIIQIVWVKIDNHLYISKTKKFSIIENSSKHTRRIRHITPASCKDISMAVYLTIPPCMIIPKIIPNKIIHGQQFCAKMRIFSIIMHHNFHIDHTIAFLDFCTTGSYHLHFWPGKRHSNLGTW